MLESTRDLMASLMGESSEGSPTPSIARTGGSTPPIIGAPKPTPEFAKIHPHYEQWTKAELYSEAKDREIQGRSSMDKQALVEAIRAKK